MARWATGERTVTFLLDRNRLEDLGTIDLAEAANEVLGRATRRVKSAATVLEGEDFEGAYSAAYDAYRMAGEALLVRQGLRATGGEGSHVTVEDAVSAQFGDRITAFAKPTFERMRRTRHTAQYFDPSAAPIERGDAEWALRVSEEAVEGATTVLSSDPPDRFSE